MYHFSLHLNFCKNTCKLFWKYFCFAFIHYRRAQFILSKFANFCLSEFSMFRLKFSLLKPHPKNTPHFNTSFVKISENFSTHLHLFIRVPIYPFHVRYFYLFSLFCLHWKFTYICSRWNKQHPQWYRAHGMCFNSGLCLLTYEMRVHLAHGLNYV